MSRTSVLARATLALLGAGLVATAAGAQPPGAQQPPVQRMGTPVEPRPDYVRTAAPTDPVIQRILAEGMGA